MPSLQDQLLGAGLVDAKKAKAVKKSKQKQAKVERRSKEVKVDEAKQAAQQALAEKQARDKALNQEREKALQEKAIAAQIKQLIQNHQKPKQDGAGEVEYNFTDGAKIKKMLVSNTVQRQIISGVLAIVRLEEAYYLVPAKVAEKIAERDASYVVITNTTSEPVDDEDDPYKDYVIPDDLMW